MAVDTIYIAVIDESDYSVFRKIGKPNEFPEDFGAFVRRVEQFKTDYLERGYRVREVKVDAAGFHPRRGCRFTTYKQLVRYAARLVARERKRKA